MSVLVSIVVSIPACHAGDRGSIPRRGGVHFFALRDGQILVNGLILLTCKDTPEVESACNLYSLVEFSPATWVAQV